MYKAEIIEKKFEGGLFSVVVKYVKDDGKFFFQTFQTNVPQDTSWPTEQIKKRLAEVNDLENSAPDLAVGTEILHEVKPIPTDPIPSQNTKEQYASDLRTFERYVNAISKGFTDDQRAAFVSLKQKLTDNFQDDYIDLF